MHNFKKILQLLNTRRQNELKLMNKQTLTNEQHSPLHKLSAPSAVVFKSWAREGSDGQPAK